MGSGVRVETALYAGYTVVPFYDSLVCKLIVWAPTREEAISRGRRALEELEIDGIKTSVPLHLRLLDDAKFRAGDVHTSYLEQVLDGGRPVGTHLTVQRPSRHQLSGAPAPKSPEILSRR